MSRERTHLLNILFFKKGNNLSFCFACVDVYVYKDSLYCCLGFGKNCRETAIFKRELERKGARDSNTHRASEREKEGGQERGTAGERGVSHHICVISLLMRVCLGTFNTLEVNKTPFL